MVMSRNSFAFISLLAFALGAAASHHVTRQSDGPIIDLGYAQYRGAFNASSNTTSFLGVRYAQNPTGDLRWRAPQAPLNVSGVQQANTPPNMCFASSAGTALTNPFRPTFPITKRAATPVQDEDCLFLNVFTPGQLEPNASLPVVFWIHGGGYDFGSLVNAPAQDFIPEAGFGVVSVAIQYRLGLFGFLPGSAVHENGDLNVGLLDQTFALQWVQDNIALFGGDPTKVTIWGESAGAGSVIQHLVANGGQTDPPLFRGAMTSSTFLPFQYNFNDTIPEQLFTETAVLTRCQGTNDTLACLRAADVSVLQDADVQIDSSGFSGLFVFVPVVDGTFIVERPIETISKGTLNGQALLSVTNTFEGRIFVNASTANTTADYVTQTFPLLTEAQIDSIVQTYADFDTPLDAAIAIQGESIFICPTYFLLDAFNGTSHKGEFAIQPGNHAEDLSFYFPDLGSPTFDNQQFITAFDQSFLSFVRFLDPNQKFEDDIKPEWPMFADGHTEMLFNETDAGQPLVKTFATDPALLERCAFWKAMAPFTHQ